MGKAISQELMDEVLRDKDNLSKKGGVQFWKVPTNDGTNYRIRVLPGTFGTSRQRWYASSSQHWSNQKPYECPRATDEDAECPFCEKLQEMRKQEQALKAKLKGRMDDADHKRLERQATKLQEMIKQLLPKQQFLLNILEYQGEGKYASRSKVYRAPKMVFESMMTSWTAEADDGNDLFDPTDGNDFRIAKKKEGTRTTYQTQPVPKKTAIAETKQEIETILEKVTDLEGLVDTTDVEAMQKAVDELMATVDDALDEDKPQRKPRVSVDDDDEDKPRSKRRDDDDEDKPRRRPVDDDDEDKPKAKRRDDDDEASDNKGGGNKAAVSTEKLRGKLNNVIGLGEDDD